LNFHKSDEGTKIVSRILRIIVLLLTLSLFVLPAAAQEPVTISFVHIFGGENDTRGAVVQGIADAFMAENPNVIVEVSSPSLDYTELFNNSLLAAEQGNSPTIVQIEEGLTQLAADSGYFTPIAQIASAEQLASLDDMLDVVVAYYTIGGELYSVPWNASNPILYYNKDMFTAAGLDPEVAPQTFDDILAACAAIDAVKTELEITSCMNIPMTAWLVEQWMAMQNAELVNNGNGRTERTTEVYFESPEMVEIAEWYALMASSGYLTYSGTPNDLNAEGTTFLGKQTAITINSTAGLTLIQRFSTLQGFELGVARMPLPDADATNGVTMGGASLWVSSSATPEQAQAASDFLFFLTNTANDQVWHQNSGYFPIRASSIDALTEAGWFETNPNFAIAIDQLRESVGNIANAGAVVGPSTEVRGILVEALQSIVDSGTAPAEALAVAKQRADAVLADYNAVVGG